MKFKLIIGTLLMSACMSLGGTNVAVVVDTVTRESWQLIHFKNPTNTYAGISGGGGTTDTVARVLATNAYDTSIINSNAIAALPTVYTDTVARVLATNAYDTSLINSNRLDALPSVYTDSVARAMITNSRAITTWLTVFAGETSRAYTQSVAYSELLLEIGRSYISDVTNIDRTCTLSFSDHPNMHGTNAFWRANTRFYASGLDGTAASGANTAAVVDASGFTTNELVVFQDNYEMARVAYKTNNILYFENNLAGNHSATGLSRVVEYGGFTMIDWSGSNKIHASISPTNPVAMTGTITTQLRYK